jgi:hypothetical protein
VQNRLLARRIQFEDCSAVHCTALHCGADEIASGIPDQSRQRKFPVRSARESVKYGLVIGRIQLEDRAAANPVVATGITTINRRAIEVALRVSNQTGNWHRAVRGAGETV